MQLDDEAEAEQDLGYVCLTLSESAGRRPITPSATDRKIPSARRAARARSGSPLSHSGRRISEPGARPRAAPSRQARA